MSEVSFSDWAKRTYNSAIHDEQLALMSKGIRVFVEQKAAGDFGFVIYIKTGDAGKPWNRHSFFTQHFDTYTSALEAGIKAANNIEQVEK